MLALLLNENHTFITPTGVVTRLPLGTGHTIPHADPNFKRTFLLWFSLRILATIWHVQTQ